MKTDQVSQAPSIEYTVTEDGKVMRTDKDGALHVATLSSAGVLELIPENAKFRPAVVRFLNEQAEIEGTGVPPIKSIILAGDKPDADKNIPPCPKPTMRDGDKTPAVVEWYRKYKPSEYKARYGIIGEGKVMKEKTRIDDEGKPVKTMVEIDALLAERKIHLTERPEAQTSQGYADEEPTNI